MNNAMLRESQRAIQQAATVAKLTKLAFLFVPLTLASAFFGMNSTELDNGALSLWVFFAVAIPIVMLSVLLMRTDREQLTRLLGQAKTLLRRRKKPGRHGPDAEDNVDVEMGNI
ncbi:Putative Mg2+ transporter protein, CorA-like/Zinc transport protein ZntB [Septoria linicola]|uniref:Mg2+ transporter protein, CorA-like/Zinc transport protein ZntB n=1 Tax=Septoria linicola TaxID=215465 RepID=A0A9Q9EP36_9PEZI|nr:Putative Mg2+ transporter protein, CorA-like/Zinc transport protein ZntB [Septoria linicola]